MSELTNTNSMRTSTGLFYNKNRLLLRLASALVLMVSVFSVHAQGKQAFVDYPALLNVKFYDANGGLLIEKLPIFFAPENKNSLKIELISDNQQVLFSKAAYFESWSMPVVDGIKAKGSSRISVGKTGNYILRVTENNKPISQISFSMSVDGGDDPFNPKEKFTRDGPWNKLAYLSTNPEKPQNGLTFNWWSRLSDLPSGKKGNIMIKLMKDGKEVAKSTDIYISKVSWQHHSKQLKSSTNHIYTLKNLVASDGEVKVVILNDGKIIKSFDSIVVDGELQAHPRSKWGYSPIADFLSPKVIANNSRKKIMVDAVWLETN